MFEFMAQGLKELKVVLRIGEENDREPLVYGFHFLIECCGVRV